MKKGRKKKENKDKPLSAAKAKLNLGPLCFPLLVFGADLLTFVVIVAGFLVVQALCNRTVFGSHVYLLFHRHVPAGK